MTPERLAEIKEHAEGVGFHYPWLNTGIVQELLAEVSRQAQEIAELRAALEGLVNWTVNGGAHIEAFVGCEYEMRQARNALLSAPSTSLAAHDDEVIERCIKAVCVFCRHGDVPERDYPGANLFHHMTTDGGTHHGPCKAAAIRALKGGSNG